MFTPRKNKHIRRKVGVEEEDPPVDNVAGSTEEPNPNLNKPKKAKKKAPATVLSFGDEEQDTEETFKVKKSSSSRKIGFNKERAALDKDLEPLTITSRASVSNSTSYSKEAMEELRRSTQSKTPSVHIPQTDENLVEEKFPTLLAGSTTIIPDANQIHLAKKRREQMRLRNDRDEEEFISLTGGDDLEVVEQRDTRLVREEDDEMDDGEADLEKVLGDRLALGKKAQKQAEKSKRAARKEMIEDMDEDPEDEEETREWEMRQIRNAGFTKKGPKQLRDSHSAVPTHKPIAFPTITPIPTMVETKKRLEAQLAVLKDSHRLHLAQLKQIRHEEANLAIGAVEATEAMTTTSARYTFFQELRSYCRNLTGFFEEKFPELEKIEDDFSKLLERKTRTVMERRALDLKDELSEFANVVEDDNSMVRSKSSEEDLDEFGRSMGVPDPLAAKKRRMADKAKRRSMRQQSRASLDGSLTDTAASLTATETAIQDGLASDNELGAGDMRELKEAMAELEERRINILSEVGSDFKTLEAVKGRFQEWKTEYRQDYNKAYGGLLLPMVFDFYVRQETCLWDPMHTSVDIAEQSWHKAVSSYTVRNSSASGLRGDSDSEDLEDEDEEEDMDSDLMSKVVTKSICPRMTQLLNAGCVDLYSHTQAQCLKAVLDQLLDYVDKKGKKMEQLLKATLQVIVMTAQTHRSQFVEAAQPLRSRHLLGPQAAEAREMYLWKTIGLFRNLMLLRRFVPAGEMDMHVVDGLLHDCIMRLLEGDDTDTVAKYQMIYKALPHDIRSQERYVIIERMTQSVQ
ncbi:hypothetical protein BG004_007359 [Podila humilis]|nr:hypothetical protein BG004_007359 [Podila humilis]